MSENETPLGIEINIKHHDSEGIDVDGLKTEHQLTAGIASPVNDNVSVSNIQLVGVSHQESVVI